MKEFYDFRIVRWFLENKAAQMVSIGVVWAFISAWICIFVGALIPMDAVAWTIVVPLSVMIGLHFVSCNFGYMDWLERQKENLRNRIRETIPAGVRFILRDSVEQVNFENQYPGFGEALHKACIRDFFDAEDVVWVDLEIGYKDYRHFRVDKDAICWFEE